MIVAMGAAAIPCPWIVGRGGPRPLFVRFQEWVDEEFGLPKGASAFLAGVGSAVNQAQ